MLEQGPRASEHTEEPRKPIEYLRSIGQADDKPSAPKVPAHLTDPARALKLLPNVKYFCDLEESIPGFLEPLAAISEFHKVDKGTCIFRQGDPPLCLYLVVSGDCAVYKNDLKSRARTPEYRKREAIKDKDFFTRVMKKLGLIEMGPLEKQAAEDDKILKKTLARHRTFEEFSTIAEASRKGEQLAILDSGKCFGDTALINDHRRNATIICNTNCELLRVNKTYFDVHLCQKLGYFKKHVPGFQSYRYTGDPTSHPATLFQEHTFRRGHTFLKEGTSSSASVVIITSGTVAFRRTARMNLGLHGRKEYRTWLEMGPNDTFCSISMLGLGNVEPYSVVVTSDECKCFMRSGSHSYDFQGIPRDVLEQLLDHVRQVTKPVLQLGGSFAGLDGLPSQTDTRQAWGGVVGPLPSLERPTSRRTLRHMRQKASEQRRRGNRENPVVWPGTTYSPTTSPENSPTRNRFTQ